MSSPDIDTSPEAEAVERHAHAIEYGEDNSRDYTAAMLRALSARAEAAEKRLSVVLRERDELRELHEAAEAALVEAKEAIDRAILVRDFGLIKEWLAHHGGQP